MTPTLVLFDIDGTLLRSQGVGVSAMQQAFDELYPSAGVSMEGVPVAGRLDSLIWADVMRRAGLDATLEEESRFREAYTSRLAARLANGAIVRRMPGVLELVEALAARADAMVGLVTGNWPVTARMKLSAAGFDPGRFRLGAFAGDGPDRRALPPVAMRRCAEAIGRPVAAERVVVIGDTPADVDCATFNGCRALAVATGDFSVEELRNHRPDRVVTDLSDVTAALEWMTA